MILIIAVGMGLYYSGAGSWLMGRTRELGGGCYALMGRVGFQSGQGVCDGIARGVDYVADAASTLAGRVRDAVHGTGMRMEGTAQEVFARLHIQGDLAAFTSPAKRLQAMIEQTPTLADARASAAEKLQLSLDQFVIGQQYMQQAAPEKAAVWFQESARQPGGYGVLSQLTLGDMYSAGHGVGQSNEAARYYYAQAQRSLATLEADSSDAAQTLLANLPADTKSLRQQLSQRLQQLQ